MAKRRSPSPPNGSAVVNPYTPNSPKIPAPQLAHPARINPGVIENSAVSVDFDSSWLFLTNRTRPSTVVDNKPTSSEYTPIESGPSIPYSA